VLLRMARWCHEYRPIDGRSGVPRIIVGEMIAAPRHAAFRSCVHEIHAKSLVIRGLTRSSLAMRYIQLSRPTHA